MYILFMGQVPERFALFLSFDPVIEVVSNGEWQGHI